MAKAQKMDKLAQDARAAREAGMSYGKWKSLQPVVIPETRSKGIRKICLYCGSEFYQRFAIEKKYCDSDCRNADYKRRREERKN